MNNLLIAIMYPNQESLNSALAMLNQEFGEVKSSSKEYDFNFTNYYKPEFGTNLKKQILIFKKTIEKQDLIEIRNKTADIEKQLSKEDKRTANLDPGYISNTELVLATKKYRSFKEKLNNEIFAHKVLEFKDNEIITFFHTFADYKIELVRKFLTDSTKSI